jgi:hypothetical protein
MGSVTFWEHSGEVAAFAPTDAARPLDGAHLGG